MKSIPEVQVQTGSDTTAGGGGGRGKVWKISGRLQVRETEIDGRSHDRPLKGVEVKVSASDISGSGPWTQWGTVRTDAEGDFALSESNNGRTRFFRVQARFLGEDLEIEDATLDDITSLDVTDENWRTVWKSGQQLEGPDVSIGTRVFAPGQPEDLGDALGRRRALIWYVLRTAIDRLENEDPWFSIGRKVVVVYPARSIVGTSYNDNGTGRIHLVQAQPDDEWHPGAVLSWFMLMWHDYHTHGSRKISGYPSAEFARGFGAFASNTLMHELWGERLKPPLNRRTVATTLELSTLDELNGDGRGAADALHLLRYGERNGWWSHLFGTAQSFPDNRPDDDADGVADHPDEVGVKHRLDGRRLPPPPHHLSTWDILAAFRAHPAAGWDTDLQVGNPDAGVLQFIDRAVDIHGIGGDVLEMLRRCLDPLAIGEPFESLPER